MDFGPHSSFILISYALSFVMVLGLVGWTLADYARQKKHLAELEQRNPRRQA